ncbi:MAG: hypothetical protein Q3972_03085 [Corynebacterium sp.]|nr:hypothetical protein [Corynebacterium sp.]
MKKRIMAVAMAAAMGTTALVAPHATPAASAATATTLSSGSSGGPVGWIITLAIDVLIYNALVDAGLLRSVRR